MTDWLLWFKTLWVLLVIYAIPKIIISLVRMDLQQRSAKPANENEIPAERKPKYLAFYISELIMV